jgi:hypothetical protein
MWGKKRTQKQMRALLCITSVVFKGRADGRESEMRLNRAAVNRVGGVADDVCLTSDWQERVARPCHADWNGWRCE